MLSLFSCFRKKTAPETIGAWLEQQFPGRFEVLVSNLKMLDILAQYKGEKRAIVADKADPEVQFFLNWQKGVDGLGLDTPTVNQAHERAKMQVADARALFHLLQDNGLEKFSVGVVDGAAIVQVFGEPIPALREQTLGIIQTALQKQPGKSPTIVFIELLEPSAYHTEYQNIIPRGHWEAGTGWQKANKIMALQAERSAGRWTTQAWEISPESKRSMQYQEAAFQQARAWADNNLPKPFFMDDTHPFGFDSSPQSKGMKNAPIIRYSFPYFDKSPADDAEPAGYVTGIYDLDKQVFGDVQVERTF
jgi:hypothetical protein